MVKGKKFNWNLFSEYRSELMCISTIGILFCHMLTNAAEHGITNVSKGYQIAMLGSAFVDAFLFLSGIGLYYSFRKDGNIVNFYRKRFVRLLIPYLIVGIPTIIFCCTRDGTGVSGFVANITGISFFIQGETFAWFVIAIAILYLAFPLLFRLIFLGEHEKLRAFVICCIIVGLTFILRAVNRFLFENIDIALMRVPIFIIGICCGKIVYEGAQTDNKLMALGLLFGAIVTLMRIFGLTPGGLVYYVNSIMGVFFIITALIMMAFVKRCVGKFDLILTVLHAGGGYTLELYLCHIASRQFFDCPYVFWQYLLCCVLIPIPFALIVKSLSDKIKTCIGS